MHRIQAEQQRRNVESRDAWDRFLAHRKRVTSLCVAAARGGSGRLLILGAGNCNDIDLSMLLQTFREVHLVDLDEQALQFGVERQLGSQPSESSRVVLHGGIDVTGIAERLAAWSPDQPPDESELRECQELAASIPLQEFAGPFEVVTSVCLLSQLIDAIRLSIGADHPQFLDLVLSVRARHLRLLIDSTLSGGVAVLISDFLSSDTCPELREITPQELPSKLSRLLDQQNFFTGLNPRALVAQWEGDGPLARYVVNVQRLRPWLWDLGPRIYAVCAMIAMRKDGL